MKNQGKQKNIKQGTEERKKATNPLNPFENLSQSAVEKKKGWMEILPRFKIQYPMKNRGKNTNSFVISYT